MIRTVQIDDRSVEINTSAGWLYKYRENFGHDILPDIMPVMESVLNAIVSLMRESKGDFGKEEFLKAVENEDLVDAFINMAGMEMITVYNIFWALAKNANKEIPQPDEWYNSFDTTYMDEIIPVMFKGILESSISSKNVKRLLERIKTLKEENISDSM